MGSGLIAETAGRLQSRLSARVGAETLLHTLALALILVVGAAVRLWGLTAVGFNSDEAVYAGQAAAMAHVPVLQDLFPVFRAHPLLFQFVLAMLYTWHFGDAVGRGAAVAVGLITVLLSYATGRTLFGRKAGLFAALILALMPYHVVVSRQVLLDGPMTMFATLALYAMALFGTSRNARWLIAGAAAVGLTFLAKEIGFITIGAVYAFLALSPKLPLRLRDVAGFTVTLVAVMLPYPLSVTLAGGHGGGTTRSYLVWQLFRRANHTPEFYLQVVPAAIGWAVLAAAILGLVLLRRERSWRDTLLLCWILVPLLFFQLWPTKGFQYLLPIAPAVAILAGRMLARWPRRLSRGRRLHLSPTALGTALALLVSGSLVPGTLAGIRPAASDLFLAGSGGVPGGREVGEWIADHAPIGATYMTIGPSMANIVQYYGHRHALGLSVSPNPLHRNPSYAPIVNPDYQIRIGELQYVVWDAFSASRSSFFSDKLLGYARKYHGRAVHTESVTVPAADGAKVTKPVIVVYEVHP